MFPPKSRADSSDRNVNAAPVRCSVGILVNCNAEDTKSLSTVELENLSSFLRVKLLIHTVNTAGAGCTFAFFDAKSMMIKMSKAFIAATTATPISKPDHKPPVMTKQKRFTY